MNKLKEKLVGAQLVSISESNIIVIKDGKEYNINIDDDYGGCCGYNEIETKLFISNEELNRNPIITDIEHIDLSDSKEAYNKAKITFFGEYAPLAEIESLSGSGSGWSYGAAVGLICKEINLDYIVSMY